MARRLVAWGLQDASEVPPPLEVFSGQRESCLAACSRSPRTLLTLRVNGRPVTAPSIATHAMDFMTIKDNNMDVRTLLTEYDAYPPASLLSDAGSLLSLLLGLSLLSVGRWLLRLLGNTSQCHATTGPFHPRRARGGGEAEFPDRRGEREQQEHPRISLAHSSPNLSHEHELTDPHPHCLA